jgi:hypothetical protein
MHRQEPKLDDFTRSYIETMLWSTNDESDESGGVPLDQNYGPEDIDPETMELIIEDCADFQKRFGHLIEDDDPELPRNTTDRWDLAGYHFWLNREDHGVGFWNGAWPKHGDELSDAAKSYGEFDLQVDDGIIYGPGAEYYRSHRHVGEARRRPAPQRSYPYPSSPSGQYVLTRDGKEIMRGTEYEIWEWMHSHLSYSVDHAFRYEGYKITPASVGVSETRRYRTALPTLPGAPHPLPSRRSLRRPTTSRRH